MASNPILQMIADPGAQGMARLAQTGQRNKLMEMQRGQAQEAKQTSDIAQQKAGAPILHGIVSQALQIPDDAQRAQYLAKNQQALESTGMFKLEPGDERMESLTQLQGQLEPMMRTALSAGTKAFQPVTIVNPVTKEKRMVAPTVDKAGVGSFANFKMPDGFKLSEETPSEKRAADLLAKSQTKEDTLNTELAIKPQIEERVASSKAKSKKIEVLFNQREKIKANILNLDDGIAAVDQGARTGVIMSKLPSFTKASQALDNVANRLGLDVVGQTTFGALSKGELDIAKSTALPTSMEPKALREWMIKKKTALNKLSDYIFEQAEFMSESGNTRADWERVAKIKYGGNTKKATAQTIGRFTVEAE